MAELLRSRIVGRLPLLAAIVLVLAYYACIPSRRVELSSDYYPSLARAFLQGRLDLGRKDECVKLASLRDPYDAYENARIRFHSHYKFSLVFIQLPCGPLSEVQTTIRDCNCILGQAINC